MGLFDLVSNAINDPNLQANVGQIGGIVNSLQQVQQAQNLDGDSTQTLLSLVGTQVRSSLQQQQESGTNVSELLEQFGGTASNAAAVSALFSDTQQQQLVEMAAAKTGLDASVIESMLPNLVPLVLNFLQTGKSTDGEAGNNPVLSGFLDADGDGDVDIADAMMLASKFQG
jgi:hypothetical protein